MKKLRISTSCNLHGAVKGNVNDWFRQWLPLYKKSGFDALDCPLKLFTTEEDGWRERIERLQQDAAAVGLKFELCHLPFGAKPGATEEELAPFNALVHRSIDAAALLGVDYAVLHPMSVTVPAEEYHYDKWFEMCRAHMDPFAEHAAKAGVKLAVENMRIVPAHYPVRRYCQNEEELCALADSLEIGICWDFGHANISGVKQSEALKTVGKRLKVLHVNDNHAEDDVHIPPFMGNTDWADAMKGLAVSGFDGLFNYEIAANRIPDALREEFAAYLVHAADELMGLMPISD